MEGPSLFTRTESLRLSISEHSESWLPGWPAIYCGGGRAGSGPGPGLGPGPWAQRVPAPEQGHLGCCALPPHSSPLSQASLAVGEPPPPPLALEWGRLRPHPVEDVAKTVCTHAHKYALGLGGWGLPPPFLPVPGAQESPRVVGTCTCFCVHTATWLGPM